ncbi:hypothetical protein [Paenibacillus larvae]|uniref:hypothetical protein n=1 Tax=Paenibacillus larvae TaxID=1464 RepID=UPI000565825B|nr:hypothetical protein [Paenibacillus larvae]MDT2239897.1 hypothetical protein [Paenibacillus larvae]MDT2263164.1 hypothetical protein [Paenibacillus larvae]MDT2293110.1 hypothetical protein [Paenibacillus larvae]
MSKWKNYVKRKNQTVKTPMKDKTSQSWKDRLNRLGIKRLKGVKGEEPRENRKPFFTTLGTKLFFAFFAEFLLPLLL